MSDKRSGAPSEPQAEPDARPLMLTAEQRRRVLSAAAEMASARNPNIRDHWHREFVARLAEAMEGD